MVLLMTMYVKNGEHVVKHGYIPVLQVRRAKPIALAKLGLQSAKPLKTTHRDSK